MEKSIMQRIRDKRKWDIRFLRLARFIALEWSKDPSTKCGAVIVRPDRTVVSMGFNGFPMALADTHDRLNDRPTKYAMTVHCEMNAVLFSRERLDGCTLYTYPFASCDRCAIHMLQAGIKRFVYLKMPDDKIERWRTSMELAEKYFLEAGVSTAVYDLENL